MHGLFRFIGIILLLFTSVVLASVVPIEPVPNWVNVRTVELNAKVPKDEVRDGAYYLLVDRQTKVTKNNQKFGFRHFATAALSPEGVENLSQFNIEFDPNYQKIILHKLSVWRQGNEINKLGTAKMVLLQREKNLEKLIYDGDTTLNILMANIQVNDIIEYSYSIIGSNPIFENAFSIAHSLNWNIPIESIYIRLLWQKNKPLYHAINNTSLELNQASVIGGTEYWLESTNVTSLTTESKIPSWIDPYASIRFSDINQWKEVVNWGVPLFEHSLESSPEISSIADQVMKSQPRKSRQIAELLNYVQTEIRYLGIEFGVNSHKPSKASETLERRYGDCKDKVVLLISLLNEIGVTAYPALVDTEEGGDLINQLPRYSAFDHVIAKVEHDGKSYWLDPTRLNQTGDLDNIFQPNYKYSLVLKKGNSRLDKVNIDQSDSKILINETYDLSSIPDLTAKYKINSHYIHKEAEYTRAGLITDGVAKTRKIYLDFYRDYYSTIKEDVPAIFNDDREKNTLAVVEKYLVTEFWDKNDEKKKYYGRFYANAITPYLKLPDNIERVYPLKIKHPIIRKQVIKVNFKDLDWSFNAEEFTEDNSFFTFNYSVEYSDSLQQLVLSYFYQSKVDHVSPKDLSKYRKAIENARGYIKYQIYQRFGDGMASDKDQAEGDLTQDEMNYLKYFVGYLLLFFVTIIWWRIDVGRRKYHGEMDYYPVSIFKFMVFYIGTMGLYAMYWNYKNWQYIQRRDQSQIMPFARGFFYYFWYYPLYKSLAEDNQNNENKSTIIPPLLASTAAILVVFLSLFSSPLNIEILALMITAGLTLPLLHYINCRNFNQPAAGDFNSQWRIPNWLMLVLCIPFFVLIFGAEIGVMPSDSVITGDKLHTYDIKYLQRKKVIKAGEKILLFSSDAIFSNRDDGNGFTKRHVFSYWKEDQQFLLESATMDEIKNIKVTWSKSKLLEDTLIDIIREDDSSFLLYVSSVDRKDKDFVRQLKKSWREIKPEKK